MPRLRALAIEMSRAASTFEPDRWSGADCAAIAEELSATAKACLAAATRAAARAVECKTRRDGPEWLARVVGTTPAEARAALSTVAAVEDCPATADALASGHLSLRQAHEIAAAVAVEPGAEATLLEVATTRGMAGLREEARRITLGALDREQLHERQRRARSVTHWVDELGMIAGRFRLPPETGVPFVNRLDAETDRRRREARREGSTGAREVHAADAFVRIVGGTSARKSGRVDVVYVCDLSAAARGQTHGDELCHVVAGGPVPVSVVREAAVGAFVKVAVRDGRKLDTIVHYGRSIPAELRTALELGDPDRLDGAVCIEDGCDRRYGLEWDHDDPLAHGGATSYDNLKARCKLDHRAKTERDRTAGLIAGSRAPPR